MTHEISIFVKILFSSKKKNISLNKSKPSENPFNIANWLHHLILKILSLQNPAWKSQWSMWLIPSRNLKQYHHCPHFRLFFKEIFLRKSSKTGHGNLGLISSTVQVELSKLNFNFDDIRTNSLQVWTYYGFWRLLCYDDFREN